VPTEHLDGEDRGGGRLLPRLVWVLVVTNVLALVSAAVLLRGDGDVSVATAGDAPPAAPTAPGPAAQDPAPVEQEPGTAPAPEPPAPPPPAAVTPPGAFVPVGAAADETGPVDLAARFGGLRTPLPSSRLAELGFQGARSRAWQGPTDSLLVVDYRFADDAAAAAFVAEAAQRRLRDPAVAPHGFPGIAGARGLHLHGAGEHTTIGLVPRGNRAYVVGVVGASGPDQQVALLQDALQQLQAAPPEAVV
jgi:hypothetical protein